MYGDGVFRTMRMRAGMPVWWPDHYAKLTDDCMRLALPAPSEPEWQADLARVASVLPDATVKLMVTRGIGRRGYQVSPPVNSNRIAIAYPQGDADDPANGIVARICSLRLGSQPRLAGIKHLNRLENVLARMEWDDASIQEGLLLDEADRVIGGTSCNLFILKGRLLRTPRLDRNGIAGVARERLLRSLGRLGLAGETTDLELAEVLAADAVFCSNSLMGLRWVKRIDDTDWPLHPLFHTLRTCLDD